MQDRCLLGAAMLDRRVHDQNVGSSYGILFSSVSDNNVKGGKAKNRKYTLNNSGNGTSFFEKKNTTNVGRYKDSTVGELRQALAEHTVLQFLCFVPGPINEAE